MARAPFAVLSPPPPSSLPSVGEGASRGREDSITPRRRKTAKESLLADEQHATPDMGGDVGGSTHITVERRRWLTHALIAARRKRGDTCRLPTVSEPSHVGAHLYLGTAANALDLGQLSVFHITHVLNCAAADCSLSQKVLGKNIKYKKLGTTRHGGSGVSDAVGIDTAGDKVDIELACLLPGAENKEMSKREVVGVSNGSGGQVDKFGAGGMHTGGGNFVEEMFDDAREFLEEARQENGRVLLCCLSGVNRSPAVAVTYLMWLKRIAVLEAISKVREARGVVLQLEGYLSQILDFANKEDLLGIAPWLGGGGGSVGVARYGSVGGGESISEGLTADELFDVDSDLESSYPSQKVALWDDGLLEDNAAYHSDGLFGDSSSDDASSNGSQSAMAGSDHEMDSDALDSIDTRGYTGDTRGYTSGTSHRVKVRQGRRVVKNEMEEAPLISVRQKTTRGVLPFAKGVPKSNMTNLLA